MMWLSGNEFWFRPHRYGLGAFPKTWEGWVLTAAYVTAVTGLGVWLQPDEPLPHALGMVLLTALLVIIAWRKTEGGWRWRWGDQD